MNQKLSVDQGWGSSFFGGESEKKFFINQSHVQENISHNSKNKANGPETIKLGKNQKKSFQDYQQFKSQMA